MEIKRNSGCRMFSTSTRCRKDSIDVIGDDIGDDDNDDGHNNREEEGKGAWTFPEIYWKLLKLLGQREI